jgi:hypothetical protein
MFVINCRIDATEAAYVHKLKLFRETENLKGHMRTCVKFFIVMFHM